MRASVLFDGENYDDIAEEHVQRMAAALAPQLDELENLLGEMSELNAPSSSGGGTDEDSRSYSKSSHDYSSSMLMGANIIDEDDDDDYEHEDDLDEEMNQLMASEAMLRQQMEFADDFSSSLLASLSRSPESAGIDPDQLITPTKRATVEPEDYQAEQQRQQRQQEEERSETNQSRVREDVPEQRSYSQSTSSQTTNNGDVASASPIAPSTPSRSKTRTKTKQRMPLAYTLQDHADHLKLSSETIGGWYYCDMTQFLDVDPVTVGKNAENESESTDQKSLYSTELVKEYCLPVPFRKLKRLYTGLLHHDVKLSSNGTVMKQATPTKAANVAAMRAAVGSPVPQLPGTPGNQQSTEPEVQTITAKSGKAIRQGGGGKPPMTPVRSHGTSSASNGGANSVPQLQEEPLPVRTMTLRIRPDVLCGSVMEAVHSGFTAHVEKSTAIVSHILKRQGGHLRGALVFPHPNTNKGSKSGGASKIRSTNQSIVAYVVDVQLCTLKSDDLERRLVIRFYHIQDDLEALQEVGAMLANYKQKAEDDKASQDGSFSLDDGKTNPNNQIKQACSLIQRLMAAATTKLRSGKPGSSSGSASLGSEGSAGEEPLWLSGVVTNDIQYDRREDLQNAIAVHLESNYKVCPSVREENKKATPPTIRRLTLPALSGKDWSMFSVSWPLVSTLWEELETRDCTYNTFVTLPFGQFPSLPTLDVHYCSQLRRLSREAMISQLLKSAKELEDYAKSAEYSCATLLTLLDPMVAYYGVPPLAPPRAKSLEEYPLEYTPPQTACPPWGSKVMEALNQVQQQSDGSGVIPGSGVNSAISAVGADNTTAAAAVQTIQSPEAVKMVYNAFTKQDDEEQGARLGRKNAQVMDRLANMQSHQQAVIRSIRDAHIHSKVALKASDDFVIKAQKSSNIGKPGHPRMLLAQVPLLHFRISLGASTTGTCFITPNQIMFSTSFIPLVGTSKNMLFDLALVQFQVVENVTSTLLNPFPNTMNVLVDREVVFSFRPTLSPNRLWTFLNVVQTSTGDAALSEFSQPDQAVVEDEEGVLRLANTVSDDQYSI